MRAIFYNRLRHFVYQIQPQTKTGNEIFRARNGELEIALALARRHGDDRRNQTYGVPVSKCTSTLFAQVDSAQMKGFLTRNWAKLPVLFRGHLELDGDERDGEISFPSLCVGMVISESQSNEIGNIRSKRYERGGGDGMKRVSCILVPFSSLAIRSE